MGAQAIQVRGANKKIDGGFGDAYPAWNPNLAVTHFTGALSAHVKLEEVNASAEGVMGQEVPEELDRYRTYLTDTIKVAAYMVEQTGGVEAVKAGAASMIESWSRL